VLGAQHAMRVGHHPEGVTGEVRLRHKGLDGVEDLVARPTGSQRHPDRAPLLHRTLLVHRTLLGVRQLRHGLEVGGAERAPARVGAGDLHQRGWSEPACGE
jgi:hypothetical protein